MRGIVGCLSGWFLGWSLTLSAQIVQAAQAQAPRNGEVSPLRGAAKGSLRGRVLDAETGEGLLSATVHLKGTDIGAVSDLEGNFRLQNLDQGRAYTLQVSYVSYKTHTQRVQVSGRTDVKEILLVPDSELLEGVEVVGILDRGGEVALLDVQRKSAKLMDGLSAQHMRKTGDSDMAQAAQRIVGVTVEKGKYVYVRGLGDRYTKVFLNGASVPGLDPDRNTLQLDILPTQMIDNVQVFKTFAPDLPADFSGGFMNLNTKSVPQKFVLRTSVSYGYTPQAHFNPNTLTHDSHSPLPDEVGGQTLPTLSEASGDRVASEQLQRSTSSFASRDMRPSRASSFLNQKYTFSVGNRHIFLSRPLGYHVGLLYGSSSSAYGGGRSQIYELTGQGQTVLNPALSLADERGDRSQSFGGLTSVGYEFLPRHTLTFSYMGNLRDDHSSRQQIGTKPEDDPDLTYITNGLWRTERSMHNLQASGKHDFGDGFLMDWTGTRTMSDIHQPDLRFFTYGHYGDEDDLSPTHVIEPSIGQIPTRYFRTIQEEAWDARLHLTKDFDRDKKLKAGAAFSQNDRLLTERQYRYDGATNVVPDGDANRYIAADNLWSLDNPSGVYLVDATQQANNYDANQGVYAGYAMTQLPLTPRAQLTTGLRYEYTHLLLTSYDKSKDPGKLNLGDILPSLALSYRVKENLVLKSSYGRTLARPTFRELAPFASFDFIGDFILVGSPRLRRTLTDNIDLRSEYFLSKSEMISLGGFYKRFQNPIERTFNTEAPNTELTFRNVPQASVYGAELEVKKGLGFAHYLLQPFSLSSNFIYVRSAVSIDEKEMEVIRAYEPQAQSVRPMFGQSPFVVNALLSFQKKGWQSNLAYNIFGRRISVVTKGGAPNIYEQPRHSLNVNIARSFQLWKIQASVNNLLNDDYLLSQSFHGQEYVFQQYRLGPTFGLSLSYTLE